MNGPLHSHRTHRRLGLIAIAGIAPLVFGAATTVPGDSAPPLDDPYSQQIAANSEVTVDTSEFATEAPYRIATIVQGPINGWGTIFDATTHHVGFRQGDAGKTMGLSAFGEPELFDELRGHLGLREDGGFTFLSSEEYLSVLRDYTPPREPGAELGDEERQLEAL